MNNVRRTQEWWDGYFIGLARYISTASKDPSTQVGAIIVNSQRRIMSTGYNGFPCGVEDSDDRLFNRELKYPLTVHGELNAALFAGESVAGCTVYVWPFMPCPDCAGALIQKGISRVVAPESNNPRWNAPFSLSRQMFKEAGVTLCELKETEWQTA